MAFTIFQEDPREILPYGLNDGCRIWPRVLPKYFLLSPHPTEEDIIGYPQPSGCLEVRLWARPWWLQPSL